MVHASPFRLKRQPVQITASVGRRVGVVREWVSGETGIGLSLCLTAVASRRSAFAGAFYPPSIQVGEILALPFAPSQVEVYFDLITFLKTVQLSAPFLHSLKFDHLRVVAVGYFNDEFAGLETTRFLFCGENPMQSAFYFKSHVELLMW